MAICEKKWSNTLLQLVHELNNFDYEEALDKRGHLPLYIGGLRVGVVAPKVLSELQAYGDTFMVVDRDGKMLCELNERLTTCEARTKIFHQILVDLKSQNKFVTLNGWRNETYSVSCRRGDNPLCHVERAGCSLFGFNRYGVHINGYTYQDGQLKMWIGHRSKTKPTFPDMLDNMCAGGLASGLGIRECAIKESQEEAAVDDDNLSRLKSVGSLSYCYEDERGVFPVTEYLYDLELPNEFTPSNNDGEMENFYLYNITEIQSLIIAGMFKPNSALVIVDFMVRHGYITPENEPNYLYLVERMHRSLQPCCRNLVF